MADWAADQAAGLRRLFTRDPAPVVAFLAAREDARIAAVVKRCASEVAANGRSVATLRLAGAAGSDYLRRLRVEHDLLLVDAAGQAPVVLFGTATPNVKAWLGVGMEARSITETYSWLKRQAVLFVDHEIGVLALGGRDAVAAEATVENMRTLAQAQIGLDLRFVGWLPDAVSDQFGGGRNSVASRQAERAWRRVAGALVAGAISSPVGPARRAMSKIPGVHALHERHQAP